MTESSHQPQYLKFVNTIYDNVHGFIPLTSVEYSIINTQEFQRLRYIKQLGLLDFVFPGALHTRFNHSIGVLHIADKMTKTLQRKGWLLEDPNSRQIIRIAALLHDIGHYPWSHITEDVIIKDLKKKINESSPNKKGITVEPANQPSSEYSITPQTSSINTILDESGSHQHNFNIHNSRNESLDFAHHERIAGIVIEKTKIKAVLSDAGFNDREILKISQIIAGTTYNGLEKSIIHSELDADRFDYILRDSKETGVTYGLFDIDQIIRHIDFYDKPDADEDASGLFIARKGQKAVEDYLISRYFLYSTVIYQKTSIGFHKMVSLAYEGLLEREMLPSYINIIQHLDNEELNWFYNFNDLYLLEIIKKVSQGTCEVVDDNKYKINASLIKECCTKIYERKPLKLVKEEQIIRKKQDNDNFGTNLERYHEPAVMDRIVSESGIEDYWFIPSKIKRNITALSPFISLNDPDKYDKIKDETIRIGDPGEKPVFLVDDKTSIIKPLADQELTIVSIYTKDDEYKKKIGVAIKKYEESTHHQ
jgi:HD superfamily phosphohydrolase